MAEEVQALDNGKDLPEAGEAAPEQDLNAELGALREQLASSEDRALRVQAEAQNMIRRAERDVESARKFALERFAVALLPVIDNLERAIAAIGEPNEATRALAEGVQLTYRGFLDVLQKFDVVEVDPAGQPFDPEKHQAMTMVESADASPNSVVAVMQKGYTLNGRLLRPAMVVVAKPAATIDETV
ncbi:MAG: nucleotide exchange factor GrpE [Gammaproteobacteria bacterium]|nr:nucleotide exchange factor GrpE [Gammaproteobacteria bacterium]MBP6051594.1 nucleotide exchange factor GrpE [Pseudomonadales bacterium]MBK6581359.1 nucleotide exchange factor GrpE [Gammaproteobacteria bacterium]MBK7167830.1 nucleotide exchange factor GrpE [Gammaproteobacteria bacterium]MBK7518690.1 nucleotide exchange factor GrpE [Gammaproteobacteria bacterium]